MPRQTHVTTPPCWRALWPLVVILLLAIMLFGGLDAKAAPGLVACHDTWGKDRSYAKAFEIQDNWSLQLFDREMHDLKEFFKAWNGATPEILAQAILEKGVRNTLYRLEELAAIHESRAGKQDGKASAQLKESFRAQRLRFKEIENAIGRLDLELSLKKRSAELGEPTLVGYFQGKTAIARAQLLLILESAGFIEAPKDTVKVWKKEIESIGKWKNGELDKRFFVDSLASYARELREAVLKGTYDNADIELGLHKLRRALRKIAQRISILDGLVAPAPDLFVSPKTRALLEQLRKDNGKLAGAFIKWTEPKTENPILIPETLHAVLSELVTWIGRYKDPAELQIYAHEALVAMKVDSQEQDRIMAKIYAQSPFGKVDHQQISRDVQQMLIGLDLLEQLAWQIERLNP